MHSQLPACEAISEIFNRDEMSGLLGRETKGRLEDPDVTAVYANAQPQRIWTIERAKHSTE